MELQKANKLKEKRNKIIKAYRESRISSCLYFAEMNVIDNKAKANLEKLGCGDMTKIGVYCGTHNYLCLEDCLKAKEIYEEILR